MGNIRKEVKLYHLSCKEKYKNLWRYVCSTIFQTHIFLLMKETWEPMGGHTFFWNSPYLNLCLLSVMLESLLCTFTSISWLTNTWSPGLFYSSTRFSLLSCTFTSISWLTKTWSPGLFYSSTRFSLLSCTFTSISWLTKTWSPGLF